MFFFKLIYHVTSLIKIFFLKLIYRNKIKIPWRTQFRSGFHLAIEGEGFVSIGKNVFFNNYCSLTSRIGISIDDGSILGENVKIYDHDHLYADFAKPIKEQGYSSSPVVIGKHCWICSNVTILKGVHIGDNCVIAAGSVVAKDIPSNSVAMGNPAVVKKHIGNV